MHKTHRYGNEKNKVQARTHTHTRERERARGSVGPMYVEKGPSRTKKEEYNENCVQTF